MLLFLLQLQNAKLQKQRNHNPSHLLVKVKEKARVKTKVNMLLFICVGSVNYDARMFQHWTMMKKIAFIVMIAPPGFTGNVSM